MRTTLDIDTKLLEQITVLTGEKNRGIRRIRIEELKALAGNRTR